MDSDIAEAGTNATFRKRVGPVKRHAIFTSAIASVMLISAAPVTAKAPTSWDGLVQVKSKRLDLVYLMPGADFRSYTKVMIDPTEVAFEKNWRRNYNSSATGLSGRISETELQDTINKAIPEATDIFTNAWQKGGYAVVTSPGPDVLRVKTGVVNIRVNAPDTNMSARSRTFSEEAGSATLFIEARDSTTGALLGRAVDQRIVGDNGALWRTTVSNRGDFRDVVKSWADTSVRGMAELKALSPIQQ
jgi:hypothetical protein